MENNDFRAKQFLAFDALDGFREIISNCNIIKFDKIIRGEDLNEELDRIINKLKIGDMISIRYYCGMQYIESIGRVKKIDFFKRYLYILDSIVNFEDILSIKVF